MKLLLNIFIIFFSFTNLFSQNNFTKISENLNFPEGPAWNGNTLFISSCYGGYIAEISGNKASVFVDSTFSNLKQTNGLTFNSKGDLFACEYGIGLILKISADKKIEIFAEGFDGKNFNRPNDLAFDSSGNLYFTDPKSYGIDKPDGRVFKINKNSDKVDLIIDSLCFPNGIALSANGKNLFVCESAKNRILKFSINEDGSLSNQSVFIELPGGDPDGIAFDIKGNLYVAHFGSGNIHIVSSTGQLINSIKTPGNKPSNVEFGGKDLKTLFITEDETNSVYSIKNDIPGLPLFNSPSK